MTNLNSILKSRDITLSTKVQIVNAGFPGGLDSNESACNSGGMDLIPGSGRSPEEGNGNRLQYSCLENPMDRGAWWATVYGVTELDMTEHAQEKETSPPTDCSLLPSRARVCHPLALAGG